MRRFVEGVDRGHTILFPESLDGWFDENNLEHRTERQIREVSVWVEV
jgi:hypothetical protein